MLVAACSSSGGGGGASLAALKPIKFQLQWVAQSQFAGYYAALDQGYYKDLGLDVQLLLGGPNINNVQVVATGGADIGTAWLPNMLQSREGGTDLVSIAQIFQRSGHPDGRLQGRPTSPTRRAWPARRSAAGWAATSPSCSRR